MSSTATPAGPQFLDPERDALKWAQLQHMRRLATALLATMLALLAASAALQSRWPWLEWVRAFAEAGSVGALADWYAVVALFRHPLGLRMPHTAIVRMRKDDIGRGLGEFVEQNFLTPENILRKLEGHNAPQALARWLADAHNSRAAADSIGRFIPAILDVMRDDDVAGFFDRTLTKALLRVDASKVAARGLSLLTADGRHQELLNHALQAIEGWLAKNETMIREKFSEASRYTPEFIDTYIVARFVEGVIALMREVGQSAEHPLRRRFDEAVGELIEELQSSPERREQGKALVRDLIEHLRNERYYRTVWNDLRSRIETDLGRDDSTLRKHIADALVFVGRELLADPRLQVKLNQWWLHAVHELVVRFRHQVSQLIADVVSSWDAGEISRKLELEIGKDLQYIRINGTVVGGLAGLALHALTLLVGV